MNVLTTSLPGVLVIEPKIHRDERGFFIETYHEERYLASGITTRFIQDNQSASVQNTLRGLHAQIRRPQAKLVRCIEGEIFDVAVDARKGSPTFGKWYGVFLNSQTARQMYIPEGFVHGFTVVSPAAQVEYKCSDVYVADDQLTVLWNDPAIGIVWPVQNPILSPKDRDAKPLNELLDLLPLL
jgi:dTDP-4-dehydrorhamnose 3,5-epimerase